MKRTDTLSTWRYMISTSTIYEDTMKDHSPSKEFLLAGCNIHAVKFVLQLFDRNQHGGIIRKFRQRESDV